MKFGFTNDVLQNSIEFLWDSALHSKSHVLDADFASETSKLTKSQILAQAATSMLAQANSSKQSVLSLLQQ